MSKRRKILYGTAASVLFVLSVLPATSWIVWRQIGFATGLITPSLITPVIRSVKHNEPDYYARERLAAAQTPRDFPLQFAVSERKKLEFSEPKNDDSNEDTRLEIVRALRSRHADNPALHATLLGALNARKIQLPRRRDLEPPERSSWSSTITVTPASVLAEWEASASVGERLDPENSFSHSCVRQAIMRPIATPKGIPLFCELPQSRIGTITITKSLSVLVV